MIRPQQITHPLRSLRSLYRRLQKPMPKYLEIGPYKIHLQDNSQLLNYKNGFTLYDTALGRIAATVKAKYPGLHAIDIGANSGDTAALIRETSEIPVLCIEGDPILLPLLIENVAQMGLGIQIEQSFVGEDGAAIDLESAHDLGRSACLVEAIDPCGQVKFRSLQAILSDHAEFCASKLLKIDTEGFDFRILKLSIEFIRLTKPVLFFEYAPHFLPEESTVGLETLDALIESGYSDFLYYDNHGNFLLRAEASNRSLFSDLDHYLASNRRHGVAVHYFDICALHQEDADLASMIRSLTQG
jgi:FkbM family methyltransferase